MKKTLLIILNIMVFVTCFSMEFVPNEIIIKTKKTLNSSKTKTNVSSIDRKLSNFSVKEIKAFSKKKDNRISIIRFNDNVSLESIKNALKNDKNIEYIQPNYLNSFYATPTDPQYSNQRIAAEMIKLPQAWDMTTGSNQIIVGIIDSGFLFEHPDLQNNLYTNAQEIPDNGIDDDGNGYVDDVHGWDFVDAPYMADIALGDYLERDNNPEDENYHGTHVAGIIGADTNNQIGICGTAWNIKILPIRAGFRTTQGQGYLEDDDAAAGIIYSADMGCRVINLSWGDKNYSPIIEDACNYAISKGTIIVASAGNDPVPTVSYPAKLENVICVGAVNEYQDLAGFSSYGPDLDIVAPGNNILSTYSLTEEYMQMSGTSMAAPFVTGAIALLLSYENNLNLDQVRSKLHQSAKDIGNPGFDNMFGSGLLDVFKLLSLRDTPLININFPSNREFVHEEFDVIGSVSAPKFWRYSLMFSDKENPEPSDWKDILTHDNTPSYIYTEKNNEVLGHFHFVPLFKDSEYRIRIKVETTDGKSYNKIIIVTIDRQAPSLLPNGYIIQPRWVNNQLKYYVFLAFTEKVQTTVEFKISNISSGSVSSSIPDSAFILPLPENMPEGALTLKIIAKDFSGYDYETDWLNPNVNITYGEISSEGYLETAFSQGLMFTRNTFDFNNNGKQEIVGMKIDNSVNSTVKAYEYANGTIIPTFTFSEKFNPLFLGNSNSSGIELLGLRLDQLNLYEALSNYQYPDLPLWNLTDVTGAIYSDFTNDGIQDIIAVRNLPDQTVIEIYKRLQNTAIGFSKEYTLTNESSMVSRKMFIPKIVAGNLDGDNYSDLVTADVDGNILIWELINDVPTVSKTFRIPILNAYYLTIADIDGDSKSELFVGGYIKSNDFNQTYWYFEGFKSTANNTYESMGQIFFGVVTIGQSSVSSADIDGDSKSEIFLALPPNIYVVKYENNKFVPIWHGNGEKTFQIAALPKTLQTPGGFLINKSINDSLMCCFMTPDVPFTGPDYPKLFKANPIADNGVELSWKTSDADYYNIYRRDSENKTVLKIDSTTQSNYTDVLDGFNSFDYSVTAVKESLTPPESHFSPWINVQVTNLGILLSAKMININTLLLTFDQKLHYSCINRGNFYISSLQAYPSSVILINDDKSLVLHFDNNFAAFSPITLNYQNILTVNNYHIPDTSVIINYQIDMVTPNILSVSLLDKQSVIIKFSETMDQLSLNNIGNYSLESPKGLPNYSIINITTSDSSVTLHLNENISNSIYPYFIKVQRIKDLAGNVILNNESRHSLILTEIRDLTFMETYPNPLKLKDFKEVHFVHLPTSQSGEIKIYNQSGDLVYKSEINNQSEFIWDANNSSGNKVSSGLYFYIVRLGNDLKKGKLVVIH